MLAGPWPTGGRADLWLMLWIWPIKGRMPEDGGWLIQTGSRSIPLIIIKGA